MASKKEAPLGAKGGKNRMQNRQKIVSVCVCRIKDFSDTFFLTAAQVLRRLVTNGKKQELISKTWKHRSPLELQKCTSAANG